MIDRDRFFAAVRARPFGGSMTADQVAGCNAILDAWEARPELTDLRWLAYILATPFLETNKTMQPVREAYFLGEPRAESYRRTLRYYPFYGRGLSQITWEDNYRKFSPLVGVDLVKDPDRALELAIAVKILFVGMTRGLFTGVGLARYFNATTDDPVNARRIINGVDRAEEIAAIHRDFLAALGAPISAPAPTRRLLFIGVQGDDVREVERALGREETGHFDYRVDAAVRDFQERHGLEPDGIVGDDTRAKLGIA